MRLFIALNFSEPALAALVGAREELRRLAGGRGSYSPEANLHLTLAFLGEVEPERARLAAEAMRAAAGPGFELTLDRTGRFRRDGGDIWWAGGPESPALLALQRRLTRGLLSRGFELEARRFSPHVTLARRVPPLEAKPKLLPVTERVGRISLMQSELKYRPPRYTELEGAVLL